MVIVLHQILVNAMMASTSLTAEQGSYYHEVRLHLHVIRTSCVCAVWVVFVRYHDIALTCLYDAIVIIVALHERQSCFA